MNRLRNTFTALLLLLVLTGANSHATGSITANKDNFYPTSYIFTDENKYELTCNMWGLSHMHTNYAWETDAYTVATPERNSWRVKWTDIVPISSDTNEWKAVKGYPSVRMGLWDRQQNTDGLPYSLASGQSCHVDWGFYLNDFNGTGSPQGALNVTLDSFLNHSEYTKSRHDYEIMIMPYYTRGLGQATQIGTNAVIDGGTWNIFKYTSDNGDGTTWTCYQFKLATNGTSISISLKDFTDYIGSHYNPANWSAQYVQNMDAGVEIKWGSGKLVTQSYFSDVY